jgi:ferrous iron transport protein A
LRTTVDLLKIGQKATIIQFDVDKIPLKLLEMGCLPGNEVEVVQIAPFGDPIYLNVNNGSSSCH